MAGRVPHRHSWLLALVVVVIAFGASCFSGEAVRAAPGVLKVLRDAAGNPFTLHEDGEIRGENGTEVLSWFRKTPSGALSPDVFTCFNGQVFGIHLPGKPFFYVRLNPLAEWYPLQVYIDLADHRKQFLLIPPLDEAKDDFWRLVYRRAATLKSEGWLEEHVFTVGEAHPCGPEGDLEARRSDGARGEAPQEAEDAPPEAPEAPIAATAEAVEAAPEPDAEPVAPAPLEPRAAHGSLEVDEDDGSEAATGGGRDGLEDDAGGAAEDAGDASPEADGESDDDDQEEPQGGGNIGESALRRAARALWAKLLRRHADDALTSS